MVAFDLTLELAKTILEQASSAIIVIDYEQRIVYVNKWTCRIFGYTVEELIGKPLDILIPEASHSGHDQHVQMFINEDETNRPVAKREGQLQGRRKNGEVFPTEISISKGDVNSQPILIAILNDITKRRQLEEAEYHQRMLAETLQKTGEVLAGSMNLPLALEAIRQQLYRVCDYDTAVIMLLEDDHLIPVSGEAAPCLYTASPLLHNALLLNTTLTNEEAHSGRVPGFDADMQGWIGMPLVTDDVIVGFLSVGTYRRAYTGEDIEAAQAFARQAAIAIRSTKILEELESNLERLKNVQLSLIRAARLSSIGELAAGVAHQINNPLMTIVADSALLVKKAPEGSLMAESAEAIQRAATRAGMVVKRLLELSRARPQEISYVDVNASLTEAIGLVRSQIAATGTKIHFQKQADLPLIKGSDEHLQDVFINLLLNARDAVKQQPDPHITVESSSWASFITITVSDNGMGIPPQDIDKIFDPFFTTKDTGTGLGLSICYDIVKQHDGVFDVESNEGEGTTFLIHLPIREHEL